VNIETLDLIGATPVGGDQFAINGDQIFSLIGDINGGTLLINSVSGVDFDITAGSYGNVTGPVYQGSYINRYTFDDLGGNTVILDIYQPPILGDGDADVNDGDYINGPTNDGDNIIDAKAGDDTIEARGGDDTLIGGAGNDYMNGDTGNDTADYREDEAAGGAAGTVINLQTDTATDGHGDTDQLISIENAIGTDFDDTMTGQSGEVNILDARGNNDDENEVNGDLLEYGADADDLVIDLTNETMTGDGAGTDTIFGFENVNTGTGNDTITGSAVANIIAAVAGSNIMRGLAGDDTLLGGTGADTLFGGDGADILNGGAGVNDWIDYSEDAAAGGAAGVTINLGTNAATDGFGSIDTLSGIEHAKGTDSADTMTDDSASVNTLDAGLGIDTLDQSTSTGALIVDLTAETMTDEGANVDSVIGFENFTGGAGNDTINGTIGINILNGGAGDDIINGLAGNDTLNGDAGNDTISDGTGIDLVTGGADNDIFIVADDSEADNFDGGSEIDTLDLSAFTAGLTVNLTTNVNDTGNTIANFENVITTGAYADTLTGTAAVNVLTSGDGADILDGADGADTLQGEAGADTLIGGAGADTLDGGADVDIADYAAEASKIVVDMSGATKTVVDGSGATDTLIAIEQVDGSANDDTFTGDDALSDTFYGNGGNDTLEYGTATAKIVADLANSSLTDVNANVDIVNGFENINTGSGADTIDGTATANIINAGAGADYIDGAAGDDTIYGGDDNDTLIGGLGDDSLDGGAAGITVDLSAGGSAIVTDTHGDTDTLVGIENIIATGLSDTFTGDNATANVFDGLGGEDWVDQSADTGDITVNLGTSTMTDENANVDTISNVEHFIAGAGDDAITGSAVANTLLGNDGADTITGLAGNDYLEGGAGADILDGGADNDTLIGGADADTLTGGAGNDSLDGGAGADILNDDAGVDIISGGSEDDIIVAFDDNGAESDTYYGDGGSDTLDMSSFDDNITINIDANTTNTGDVIGTLESVYTGSGIDTITGTAGANTIISGAGADYVDAAGGADNIQTEAGADIIIGGAGADIIDGGADFDTVDYSAQASAVVVNFAGATDTVTGATTDTLIDIESVIGTSLDDTFTGNEGIAEIFDAGTDAGGGDLLEYGADTDDLVVDLTGETMTGDGAGTDTITGFENVNTGTGADTITGTATKNIIDAGDGANSVMASDGDNTITTGTGIDYIRSGTGADLINAGAGDNDIDAGSGNNNITTTTGADTIVSGAGDDTITAGSGLNTITAGDGANQITTGADKDIITSGTGDDSIDAGAGDNTIIAGDGVNIIDAGTGADDVTTGSGNDTINVSGGDNVVDAGEGANTITATTGADTITAGDGNNIVDSGAGADIVTLGNGDNSVTAGTGNDTVVAGTGANSIDGGDGNDQITVTGTTGVNTVDGGIGDDIIVAGASDDVIIDGAGNDTITAGDGANTITVGDGLDTVTSGAGADRFIIGNDGDADNLNAGSGDDWIDYSGVTGGGVVIDLTAGTASDNGGTNIGTDSVSDFENVIGTASDDIITANSAVTGSSTFDGGAGGVDFVSYEHETAKVVVDLSTGSDTATKTSDGLVDTLISVEGAGGGSGDDTFIGDTGANLFEGNAGDDIFFGGDGNDTLNGGAGDDTFIGELGDDVMDGGTSGGDDDYLNYTADSDGIIIDLGDSNSGTAVGTSIGDDTISNFERISMGSSGDVVRVTSNLIAALAASNIIDMGGSDNDTLEISGTLDFDGADLDGHFTNLGYLDLTGATPVTSDDFVIDADQLNNMRGGTGDRSITITAADGQEVVVNDGTTWTESIPVSENIVLGITTYTFTDGPNTLIVVVEKPPIEDDEGIGTADGDAGDNRIYGLEGDDSLFGDAGNDLISGGPGNDTINGGDDYDTAIYYNDRTSPTPDGVNGIIVDMLDRDHGGGENDGFQVDDDGRGGKDVLLNIENVTGGIFDDTFYGDNIGTDFDGYAGTADLYTLELETAALTITLSEDIGDSYQTLTWNGNENDLKRIDIIRLGAGNDTFTGASTDDVIDGFTGDDTFIYSGGNDTFTGGAGVNTLDYSAATGVISFDYTNLSGAFVITQEDAVDKDLVEDISNLITGSGADIVNVDFTAGTISSGSGDDTITGGDNGSTYILGADADTITAGAGIDLIDGGAGADVIVSGGGDDSIFGGSEDDIITAGAGADTIDGGTGTDTLYASSATDSITIDFGATLDGDGYLDYTEILSTEVNKVKGVEEIHGGDLADNVILGGASSVTFFGEDGNDLVTAAYGASHTIDGGDGTDTIDYSNLTDRVVYDATAGTMEKYQAATLEGTDSINQVEFITGTDFNDIMVGGIGTDTFIGGLGQDDLQGGDGADYLDGGDGVDVISGGDGDDVIYGGAGDDQLTGGAGADTFYSGDGVDTIDGNAGIDLVDYSAELHAISVTIEFGTFQVELDADDDGIFDGSASELIDELSNIEAIRGTGFDDVLIGQGLDTGVAETFYGGDGNDYISISAGNDTAFGEGGDDEIKATDETFLGAYYDGGTTNEVKGDTIDFNSFGGTKIVFDMGVNTVGNVSANSQVHTAINFENVIGSQSGADTITGDGSANVISGGRGGRNVLDGGGGVDTIDLSNRNIGGADFSRIEMSRGWFNSHDDATDTTFADTERDEIYSNFENLIATNMSDTIVGTVGNNNIVAGGGSDTIDGDAGLDTLDYSYYTYGGAISGITANLAGLDGSVTDFWYGSDIYTNLERIIGSDADDTFVINNISAAGWLGNTDYLYDGFSETSNTAAGGIGVDMLELTGTMGVVSGADLDVNFDNIEYLKLSQTAASTDSLAITGDDIAGLLNGSESLAFTLELTEILVFDISDGATWLGQAPTISGSDLLYTFADDGDFADDDNITLTIKGDFVWGTDDDNSAGGIDYSVHDKSQQNVLIALKGDDTFFAGDGDDILLGYEGNDVLYGQADDDTIEGGDGDDTLDGGDDNDILRGGLGDDVMVGGTGIDTVDYSKETTTLTEIDISDVAGAITVTHDNGDIDTITSTEKLSASRYNDTFAITTAAALALTVNNIYDGALGNDVFGFKEGSLGTLDFSDIADNLLNIEALNFTLVSAGVGADVDTFSMNVSDLVAYMGGVSGSFTIDGKTGFGWKENTLLNDITDSLYDDDGTWDITSTVTQDEQVVGDSIVYTLEGGGETITLSINLLAITGTAGNDVIDNGSADPTGTGDDQVESGGGDDTITTYAGNDLISSGTGNDTIDGGDDFDITSYYSSSQYNEASKYWFSTEVSGDYTISQTFLSDSLNANVDVDTLTDVEGMYGSAFDDYIYANNISGLIKSYEGDDRVATQSGDDTVFGGEGNDILDARVAIYDALGGLGNITYLDVAGGTNNLLLGDNGIYYSMDTGNFYELSADALSDYSTSSAAAAANTLNGSTVGGHLMTIVDTNVADGLSTEDAILQIVSDGNNVRLGGGDGGTDGTWIWTEGPDAGIQFWSGDAKGSTGSGTHWLSEYENFGDGAVAVSGENKVFYDSTNDFWISGYSGPGAYYITEWEGDAVALGATSTDSNTLYGEAGNDTLFGFVGDDTLEGGADNDVLFGGGGLDTLDGGDGDDRVYVATTGDNTVYIGGDGAQTLGDILDGSYASTAIIVDLEAQTLSDKDAGADVGVGSTIEGFESVVGSAFDDLLTGRDSAVLGEEDTIDAGRGNDTVYAGAGADFIRGYTGDDTIYGEAGDDIILDGTGADTLDGGDGSDTFLLSRDKDSDTIIGGETGESGYGDILRLGDGIGSIAVDLNDAYGTETFVDMVAGTVTWKDEHSENAVDSFSEIESVYGTANGFDTVYGDAQDNLIWLDYGGGFVKTGGGNDTIYSRHSGVSEDTVSFEDYTDGDVTVTIDSNGITTANISNVSTDTHSLQNITHIVGTNYTGGTGDIITGDDGANKIYTQDGDDTAIGGSGDDVIDGRITLGQALAEDRNLIYDVRTDSVYKFVTETVNWTVANAAASAAVVAGIAGRLVTIESSYENAVLDSYRPASGGGAMTWLGAQYNSGDGTWAWNGGPNDGVAFYDDGFLEGSLDLFVYRQGSSEFWEPQNTASQPYLYQLAGTYEWADSDNTGAGGTNDGAGYGYFIEWDASEFNALDTDTNNNNLLEGGIGADTIYGSGGDDVIYGYSQASDDNADSGNVLLGGAGSDTVIGAAGNDSIYVSSDGVADTYDGNSGTDSIRADQATGGVNINLTTMTITDVGAAHLGADVIIDFENAWGSNYGDTLIGTTGNNYFRGLDGDDYIDAGDGADTIYDGFGADTIYGGLGADKIYVFDDNSADVIYATDGGADDSTEDWLYSEGASGHLVIDLVNETFTNSLNPLLGLNVTDTIIGFEHVDTRSGFADTVTGTAGNNTIIGNGGDDVIEGGDGADYLYGEETSGAGDTQGAADRVVYANATEGIVIDFTSNIASNDGYGNIDYVYNFDQVIGSDFDDIITLKDEGISGMASFSGDGNDTVTGSSNSNNIDGGDGDDLIMGGDGDDIIDGEGDNDTIYGEDGADTMTGGLGNDYLDGGARSDTINGNEGDDTIFGGDGQDLLLGGDDNDTISGDADVDDINGGNGDDIIYGGTEADILTGGEGADTVYGDDGDDIVNVTLDNFVDAYYGGDAATDTGTADQLFFNGGTGSNGTIVDMQAGTIDKGGTGTYIDTFTGFETVVIFDTNLTIYGDLGDDIITAQGSSSNVTMSGGDGADTLTGTGTSDWLDYGAESGGGAVTVNLLAGTATDSFGKIDTLSTINNVIATTLADVIHGSNTNNTIIAGTGDDTIISNGGNDDFYGDGGTDTLYMLDLALADANAITLNLSAAGAGTYDVTAQGWSSSVTDIEIFYGAAGSDTMIGDIGNDSFYGAGGIDHLSGGTGDDFLNGGTGNDVLNGDGGTDTADYANDAADIEVDLTTDKDAITVRQDTAGADYSDTLGNIERIRASSQSDVFLTTTAVLATLLAANSYEAGADSGGDGDVLRFTSGAISFEAADLAPYFSNFETLDLSDENMSFTGGDTFDITVAAVESLLGGAGNIDGKTFTIQAGDGFVEDVTDGGGYTITDHTGDTYTMTNVGGETFYLTLSVTALVATEGADSIQGNAANNTIDALGGDDTVWGADGEDVIYGRGGDDTIFGENNDDIIYGGDDNDTLYGGSGADELRGEAGNDSIEGGTGIDLILGGAGNDTIIGNAGADQITGGADIDVLDYRTDGGAGGIAIDLTALNVNDTYGDLDTVASNDIEIFYATDQVDSYVGGSADVTVYGGASADSFTDGAGAEVLDGEAGNDSFVVSLDGADDSYIGGAGLDLIDFTNTGVSGITINLGLNTLSTLAGIGNDTISGFENVIGSLGADIITMEEGVNNTIDGSSGADTVSFFGHSSGITVDLNTNTAVDVTIGVSVEDSIVNVENVIGTDQADTMTGDSAINIFTGNGGADIIDGDAGNDTLYGDGGNDTLLGGLGTDVLSGGAGNDSLDGGSGIDTADYSAEGGGITVDLTNIGSEVTDSGAGIDTLTSIEHIIGTGFVDNYTGDANNNSFTGGAGADIIDGAAGNDDLFGGDDADTIDGGIGGDNIFGGNGNDIIMLTEDGSSDQYDGGAGLDLLDASGLTGALNVDLTQALDSNKFSASGLGSDIYTSIEGAIGTTFNDSFIGVQGQNNIFDGNSGSDTVDYSGITGSGMVVTLNTSTDANVTVAGSADEDIIRNIENVTGSAFADTLTGDGLANTLSGNAGNDILTGGAGEDVLNGGADADTLDGGDGADTINGDGGADLINVMNTADGIDVIDGGSEIDTIDYSALAQSVEVTLNGSTLADVSFGGGAAEDQLRNIENVIGSTAADIINGDALANALTGNGGADILNGAGGNDILSGGADNDTLDGGDGLDTIDGGLNDDLINVTSDDNVIDVIDGGSGIDTIDYSALAQAVNVTLNENTAVDVTLGGSIEDNIVNIENVTGSSVADIITGDDLNNILRGLDGADQLNGGLGDDTLYGGNDNDTLDGGAGDDFLFGEAGDDLFLGSTGTDTYDGGTGGSDTIDFSGVSGDLNLDLTSATGTATKLGDSSNQDSFTEIENLILGSGADGFVMDADDLTNFTAIDGGAGLDTLSFNAGSIDLDTFGGDGFDGADIAAVFSDIEELDFTNITSTGGDFELTGQELKDILGADNTDNLTVQMDSGTGFSFANGAGLTLSGTVGNTTTYEYNDGGSIYTVDVIDNV
tara:strand:- start:862969 stop:881598 length:18630 start_codon:yes stop_codon:yes gene_type:complete